MPDTLLIGNVSKGQVDFKTAFNIDNDAFETLEDFYTWRGRVRKKRGTLPLARLQIQVQLAISPNNFQRAALNVISDNANLISQYSFGASSSIVPGTISIIVGGTTYTDPLKDGTLTGGSGSINYSTGVITFSGKGTTTGIGTFSYYPGLPVMGLEDYLNYNPPASSPIIPFPTLLAFDIKYSYMATSIAGVASFYDVNFYKITGNPFVWSGENYQQFWTTNYSGALWATNNKPGLHYLTGTYTSGTGTTTVTFNFKFGSVNFSTLIIGDKLFFNEWPTGNNVTGTVSSISDAENGNYVVTFTASETISGTGIVQMLTNSLTGQDGIKWFDGDPTGGTGLPSSPTIGWVNFSPPLSASTVSIDNYGAATYYLVGALMIYAYKDRLLFFSPYIQSVAMANTGASPIQLQDVVLWSWNGTPYYADPVPAGETSDIKAYYVDQIGLGGWISAGLDQQLTTLAYNQDVLLIGFTKTQTKFVYTANDISPFSFYGINFEYGSSSTFTNITMDQGAISIGSYGIVMTDQQSSQRIDLDIPDNIFQFDQTNNGPQRATAIRDFSREWVYFTYLPVSSGLVIGTDVPQFPVSTLFYNYREKTWAIFWENFTTYGTYRSATSYTWATLPRNLTWDTWETPWNQGINYSNAPVIVAGNPQGYVVIRDTEGTEEAPTGTIQSISSNGLNTQITSINHCVVAENSPSNPVDYLYFTGSLGTTVATITAISKALQGVITAANTFISGQYIFMSQVSGMTQINGQFIKIVSATSSSFVIDLDTVSYSTYISGGIATIAPLQGKIGKVIQVIDANNFVVNIPFINSGYIGNGEYTRLSQPLLQTKQFNPYWEQGRGVRLSRQMYLLDRTADSQVTLNIYLSEDDSDPWNDPLFNGGIGDSSLVYSQILYTCPESSNLGLSPANTNLQMPIASNQLQIWHRMNTSLLGDTIQIGITLNSRQMNNLDYATADITLHAIQLMVSPSNLLS